MTSDKGTKGPIALTRPVPQSLSDCELTHVERVVIDVERASEQHAEYENALREAGCTVERIAATDELPDSVFVEDAALIFPELAVITRPGAESRRPETASVEAAVKRHRATARLAEPATLDGGDVLTLGKRVFVGLSTRTNQEGVRQLRKLLEPFGYTVEGLRVTGCLHLKTAVTAVAPDAVVINPDWVDGKLFEGANVLTIDPAEPNAANALRIGDTIIVPAAHARTAARLKQVGHVRLVDVSELAKAEAGVTCCSLIVT
jgi:dimethylargininase